MVMFAVCLLVAGSVLSLIFRVQGLVAVALGVVIALVIGALFLSLEAVPAYSLGLTFILAIVTLQVGYGLGVVARAVFESRARHSVRSTPRSTDREEIPSSKRSIRRES